MKEETKKTRKKSSSKIEENVIKASSPIVEKEVKTSSADLDEAMAKLKEVREGKAKIEKELALSKKLHKDSIAEAIKQADDKRFEQVNALELEIKAKYKAYKALETNKLVLEKAKVTLEEEVSKLKGELKSMQTAFVSSDKEVNELKSGVESLQNELNGANKTISHLQSNLNTCGKEREKLTSSIKTVENNLLAKAKELVAEREEKDKFKKELDRIKNLSWWGRLFKKY